MSLRSYAITCLILSGTIAAGSQASPPSESNSKGIDLAAMDPSVAPGDDFYAYVNGAWLKATPIPSDKAAYGVGTILADKTRKRTVALIQEAASRSKPSEDARKVGEFYSSFMDEAGIEAKGIAPLKPQLEAIAAIADRRALARAIGGTLRADVDALNDTEFHTQHLFGVWVVQGLDDPEHNYPYLLQGGLGMPDRDYYLSQSPKMAALRKEYQHHVAAMLKLAGFSDAQTRADRIFALETKIAAVHATRVESEDVHSATKWKREELAGKAPGLDWPTLLEAAHLNDVPVFFIWQPKAVTGLSALVAKEPLDAWKDWLTFHAIEQAASFLPKAYVEERFAFHDKALNGIPQLRERWQRGADFTSVALGEIVGKLYVERYFPPAVKAQVQAMVEELKKAFGQRIDALAWMSPATKAKLILDDEVLKFFPEDAPAQPSNNLKAMRVRDLLRMSTGHQTEPTRTSAQAWTKSFLAHPVPHKPGTHFLYNTSGTYMLSAIVQKATGVTVLDYLKPRLFEPLGIEHPTWESSPQGITAGGYGLSIRTEDIARFGQLYLQKGMWHGKQLVPRAWVEAATALQTSNGSNPKSDWEQGYGYQFWRCRHGAYRGDGAFGQYCIVFPAQDAVIAITSGVRDMQAVLNLVWDHLLPAMNSSALAADENAREQLEEKLKRLSLRPQEGSGSAPIASGKKYVFPANEQKLEAIRLEGDGPVTLLARFNGVEQRIVCGRGAWQKGRAAWGPIREQPVAASGAWTGDDTFAAKVCFYETPFTLTVRLTFTGGELRYTSQSNVGFGRTKQSQLVGKAE